MISLLTTTISLHELLKYVAAFYPYPYLPAMKYSFILVYLVKFPSFSMRNARSICISYEKYAIHAGNYLGYY